MLSNPTNRGRKHNRPVALLTPHCASAQIRTNASLYSMQYKSIIFTSHIYIPVKPIFWDIKGRFASAPIMLIQLNLVACFALTCAELLYASVN